MKRFLRIISCIILIITMLSAYPSLVLAADTQLYEEYTVNDDEAFEIYGNIWAAQTFTTGTTAHTISSVRLLLYRLGTPGTVTVSIRETTAGDPSGSALTYGTLDGDDFDTAVAGAWHTFDLTPYSLEASTMYAIEVTALTGSVGNTVFWRSDGTAGAEANGQEETSLDGGLNWTGDADDDFMFEVWGEPILEVLDAQVFADYLETGDWLITLTYDNTYVPYYPTKDPAAYFYIQLLDGVVVVAQTSCQAWGYKPGSIYLSKNAADVLEWGALDYTIRLYGDFGANPYASYTMVAADWIGDLEILDTWVITQANVISTDTGVNLVTTVADRGEVLNNTGKVAFTIGIPELDVIRPEIFEWAIYLPEDVDTEYLDTLQSTADWEVRTGATVTEMLNKGGLILGVGGREIGALVLIIGILAIISFTAFKNFLPIGMFLSYMLLVLGAWLGFIDYVILAVITIVLGGGLFVWKVWLTK